METPLNNQKVTMWCGFTSSFVIGPFIFEEMLGSTFQTVIMTSARYAHMLQNIIIPRFADKHLLESTTFLQEGTPPHIVTRVKYVLRTSFGEDHVLSRHFCHYWPPRF